MLDKFVFYLRLSNPEEEESSLDFQRDIDRAKKLSLDAIKVDSATEDEQLEWALAESLKTNELLVESDFLPPALLEIDPEVLPICSIDGGEATEDKRLPVPDRVDAESFTGLQAKKENQSDNEKSEIFVGKIGESGVGGFDDWLSTQEKENEKENDEILIEVIVLRIKFLLNQFRLISEESFYPDKEYGRKHYDSILR